MAPEELCFEAHALQALAKDLIQGALLEPSSWSVQGFGMLRRKIGPNWRLQIWDKSLRTPNVSDIHDHPWDFMSIILAGALTNTLFTKIKDGQVPGKDCFMQQLIPGEGGGLIGERKMVRLRARTSKTYTQGDVYDQEATQLHRTTFVDGTVTLIRRYPVDKEKDKAFVVWESGDWVDAQPRPATNDEIKHAALLALTRLP